MRAVLIVGGLVGSLVAAGCLGAFGAIEAQKYPLAAKLWTAVVGNGQATTAAAPAEPSATRPKKAGPVVSDVSASAANPSSPIATATVAQAASQQAAPAGQASAPPAQVAAASTPAPGPQAQAAPPTPAAAPASSGTPMPLPPPITCNNPNALGISRVVQIDTAGGPGFGIQHFRTHDFLNDHEVVLTFDDGPWLNNTPMVLKALADQCVRATFFAIGLHSTYYPEILKDVAAAGHTIGSHTWSHKDLSKLSVEDGKTEIEMGMSAVRLSLGAPIAPFFRFPALKHPPELVTYLGERNVGIFSCDFDSFDFKMHKPEQVIKSVMDKLAKYHKGIILMHDFHKGTAEAIPTLLAKLKAGGYKVVHMVPKDQLQTLPQYDEEVQKNQKLPTVNQSPTTSIVHTISE